MARTDCAIAQLAVVRTESKAVLGRALSSREHLLSAVHLRLVRHWRAGKGAPHSAAEPLQAGITRGTTV